MKRGVRIGLVLACVGFCLAGAWVRMSRLETDETGHAAQLYAVVCAHLEALREADLSGAYRQVSSVVQETCNILEFERRVRTEYPELAQAARVEFGPAHINGARALMTVYCMNVRGQVTPCLFTLVREPEGWKIEEVRLQDRWPQGRRLRGLQA